MFAIETLIFVMLNIRKNKKHIVYKALILFLVKTNACER